MHCAACASSVASMLSSMPGVSQAHVNYANAEAWVEYAPQQATPAQMATAVQQVGYQLLLETPADDAEAQWDRQKKAALQVKQQLIAATLLTAPVFVLGMFFMGWAYSAWVSALLTLPVMWVGRGFYMRAWKQARHRQATMDTLVALSTSIAFLFSVFNTLYPSWWTQQGLPAQVYFESVAVIITFILLGKWLEARAKGNTSQALRSLLELQPTHVLRIGAGNEEKVSISEVAPGDHIRIRPGDKIPFDGSVLEGNSSVEESTITGEPLPVTKTEGDALFAGTLNQQGTLVMQAEKVGAATVLGQIIARVREAQGSQAPIQRLVDRIAGIFVPIVIGIALITFGVWLIWGGENAITYSLLSSVSVLVIACPCALGLATPTAIMVGVGKGAANHILIREAASLEQARQVTAVVVDKTGTLTEGKPQVQATFPDWSEWSKKDRAALYGLETASEHPLAQAIVDFVGTGAVTRITDFQNEPGQGVMGRLGKFTYRIGKRTWLEKEGAEFSDSVLQGVANWETQAFTPVWVARDETVVGALGISDTLKPTAASAVESLQAQGRKVYLLTGDAEAPALAVAQQVGIPMDRVLAQHLPQQKSDFVAQLQEGGEVVAMVGDGVNDAEALALAEVSMAMGHGADVAREVADITLITSDPQRIPMALRLSEKTVMGIRQNLFWAFFYNLIGIPIAAGVLFPFTGFLLNPMIAGAAMAFSSVSVVLNSLRLRALKL